VTMLQFPISVNDLSSAGSSSAAFTAKPTLIGTVGRLCLSGGVFVCSNVRKLLDMCLE
jgi:chorismate synthase